MNKMLHKLSLFFSLAIFHINGIQQQEACIPVHKHDDPLYPIGQNYINMTVNLSAHKYHKRKTAKRINEDKIMTQNVIVLHGKELGAVPSKSVYGYQ